MHATISWRRIRAGTVLCGLLWSVAAVPGQSGAQAASEPVALPPAIPIFPLQDVMLFPNASRPLHIFEPRYREMVADALEGDRIIGMVMLHAGYEDEYAGNPPIYDIGAAGVITNVERLPDGRYNIVLSGLARFRIASEDRSRAYRWRENRSAPGAVERSDRTALRGNRPLLMGSLASVAHGPGRRPTSCRTRCGQRCLAIPGHERPHPGPAAARGTGGARRALIGLLERGELSR